MKRRIVAADDMDTRVKDATSMLKDDFDFLLESLSRLDRTNRTTEAIDIAGRIATDIDNRIIEVAELLGE